MNYCVTTVCFLVAIAFVFPALLPEAAGMDLGLAEGSRAIQAPLGKNDNSPKLEAEARDTINRVSLSAFAEEIEVTSSAASSPRGRDDSTVPGALVALIFGIFGLLVIARRGRK